MQTPFSLRIFVADGDPDGLRIVEKSNWIGKALVFPRALLPISTVITQFVNLLPQIGILLVTLLIIQHQITWGWLALIPILFLMTMFSAGLAMIAARLTAQVRDLSKLLPFVTRIFFYISGIFFSVDKVLANHPDIYAFVKWNPVYDFIEIARGALVEGYTMETDIWIACVAWAVPAVRAVFGWTKPGSDIKSPPKHIFCNIDAI